MISNRIQDDSPSELCFGFLNKLNDYIFKFLRIFVLLRECPVKKQTSSNENPPYFYVNYSVHNFSENIDVGTN